MTAATAILGMSACMLLLGLLFNLLRKTRVPQPEVTWTQLERIGAARTQAATRLARPMILLGTLGVVGSTLLLVLLK
jgi:hypothetical protein